MLPFVIIKSTTTRDAGCSIICSGHHAQGTDGTCCAGGIYQTSRRMHAPKCLSISEVVAADRRLTSLAETLRTAHFSGTTSPCCKPNSLLQDILATSSVMQDGLQGMPHPGICADVHIMLWSYAICM